MRPLTGMRPAPVAGPLARRRRLAFVQPRVHDRLRGGATH